MVEDLDVDVDVPSWVGTVLAVIGVILVFVLVLGITRTFSLPSDPPPRRAAVGQPAGRRSRSQEDLDLEAAADSSSTTAPARR